MESVLAWIAQYGDAGLFAALMLGIAGLPIPDETILIFCGYLIASRRMTVIGAYSSGLAGSVCGITLSYVLGRTLGRTAVVRYGRYVHLTPQRLAHVEQWFARVGEWLLVFGYFILGVRHFTALVAGMSQLPFARFARSAYPGAALWVATFLGIGYLVGDHWREALVLAHRYSLAIALMIAGSGLAWYLRGRERKT